MADFNQLLTPGAVAGPPPERGEGGDEAGFGGCGKLLDVRGRGAVQFEQHRHGEWALVLFDLVEVAGREVQGLCQRRLRQAPLGTQAAQLDAHEDFFHCA